MSYRKPFSELKRHGRLKRLRKLIQISPNLSDESEIEDNWNVDDKCDVPTPTTSRLLSPHHDEDSSLSEAHFFDLIDDVNDSEIGLSDGNSSGGESEDDIRSTLRDWSIQFKTTHVALTALLCILRAHACFKNLPSDARTLLKTPISVPLQVVHPGHYVHIGICHHLEKMWANIVSCVTTIQLLVGVDGISLFKSSCSEMWPIMARIVNVPSLSKTVFPIGLYYGKKKPDCCVEYLSDFVLEISNLIRNGFVVAGKKICVDLKGICCDTPAKAFILGTKGHAGYSSCTRCKQKGRYYKNRMTFPDLNSELRTSSGFLMQEDREYHTTDTPLVNIPGLDFVASFPLDYMHLVCLGVVRSILYIWIFAKPPLKLQFRIIDSISSNLVSLQSRIPLEFIRRPRSLIEVKRWKATEFRQFLLYTGPIVLYNTLLPDHKPLYDNFLTLHVSMTILLSPELCHTHQAYAKDLLEHFVSTFQLLYGKQFMSHNFHNLLHLSDDISHFGHLDSCSAFPFENYLYSMKKLVRKGGSPLQQIVKRVLEISNSSLIQQTQQDNNLPSASTPHSNGPLLNGCDQSQQFKAIHFQSFKITISQPNNCCVLNDGRVVIVKNIVFSTILKCMTILCYIFTSSEDFYGPPLCPSSALGIRKVKDLSPALHLVPISNIKCKALMLPLRTCESVVVPIVHCDAKY